MSPRDSDPAGGFPATAMTLLAGLKGDGAERRRSIEGVTRAYWRPVYSHLRLRWRKSPADAADLTQGFFAAMLERDFFASYDASRGRFRTFLRACLDRFATDEQRKTRRVKRGGDQINVSFDFASADRELGSDPLLSPDPDAIFA